MVDPALWPGRPRPLADETFSSWFCRLAHANGQEPGELFRVALPGGHLHSRDLDRVACPSLISALATRTGYSEAQLRHLTFAPWYGRLIEEDTGVNKLPWIAPVGREISRKSFGQQICPKCLEEGTPYLRKTWRLGFVTACPMHRVLLLDRCPQCGAPISPVSSWHQKTHRFVCAACSLTLSGANSEVVESEDIEIQDSLLEVMGEGWMVPMDGGAIYALAFFKTLALVFRLLATGKHALALRGYVASCIGGAEDQIHAIPRIRELEHLNPRCRSVLLRMTWYLMQEWPNRFVDACRNAGPQAWDIIHGREIPFMLWLAVTSHLADPHRTYDDQELEAARAHIERTGGHPHYKALNTATGVKLRPRAGLCVPATDHVPYGQGRYWKLDGVSQEVKLAAREAAHRAGEGVGAWLDGLLRQQLNLPNVAK